MKLRARPLLVGEIEQFADSAGAARPEFMYLANQALAEIARVHAPRPQAPAGRFYGVVDDRRVLLVALFADVGSVALGPGDPAAVDALVDVCLHEERGFRILIGPDAMTARLTRALDRHVRFEMNRAQPFLAATDAERLAREPAARLATGDDVVWIMEADLRLNEEDLGISARRIDRRALDRRVRQRIRDRRTWVLDCAGGPACKLNVGTSGPAGALIEGVFTEPDFRGRGLARGLVGEVTRGLLSTHSCVGLHTARTNLAALRSYLRAGFTEVAELRLVRPAW